MASSQRAATWARRLYPFWPEAALRLIQRRGDHYFRLALQGRTEALPTPAELRRLFGPMEDAACHELLRRSAMCHARTRLLKEISDRRGPGSILPLLEVDDASQELLAGFARRNQPAIITTWHPGPTPAVWALLSRYGVATLKVQNRDWRTVPRGWQLVPGPADPMAGARLLASARSHLRRGGWVAMSFDHMRHGTRARTLPFLGREVVFTSAVGALSVMSGAPVVLVSAAWTANGRKVEVRAHPPLLPEGPPSEAEDRIMGHLVREMELFVRRHPWEQAGWRCRLLLDYPPLEGRGAERPAGAGFLEK